MIANNIYNPALQIAKSQIADVRTTWARNGMQTVLLTFKNESKKRWANRKADGLGPIDLAVDQVIRSWPNGGAGNATVDPHVKSLLTACKHWIDNRKVFGARITGWREAAIKDLYWRVAWCYFTDSYVQQALAHLNNNNTAGVPTAVTEPTALGYAFGPYQFTNSGFTHHIQAAIPRILRGDSRGPASIIASDGFQPRNLGNRWSYAPWFNGHAMGDTISTTNREHLAIEAGPSSFSRGDNSPEGNLPAWLVPLLDGANRRGFVYEFNIGAKNGTRVQGTAAGLEEIYLGLPADAISNWWVIRVDRSTFGPIPFPPPAVAPANMGWSASKRTLA